MTTRAKLTTQVSQEITAEFLMATMNHTDLFTNEKLMAAFQMFD